MNRNITILKQLLQPISRPEFQKHADFFKADRHSKGLSCWNQFVSLLFAQFTNQSSLKSIESSLLANRHCLYHLGISKTGKSTIAYANENRDYRVYEHLFGELYDKVKTLAPKHRFRFKNKLSSIDATTIDLCKSTFPWADFRKSKSGVKLVLKLNHNGHIPEQVKIMNARQHEKRSVNDSWFEENEIVAFDRGFSDYQFFANLYRNGIYFVTRLKKNAQYEVISETAPKHDNILAENTISLSGYYSKKKYPMQLRMIESHDPGTDKTIVLITNHFSLSSQTIAAIYKERWQIEIFFKMMKQYLKIKKYYGNSRNAVLTQIYIALISFLLLAFLKFTSKYLVPMSSVVAILRLNIFLKKDLFQMLDGIEKPPPSRRSTDSCQGVLF